MSKEDIIKCFLDCKGEDNGFQLTLTNKDIDVIANEIERLNNIIKDIKSQLDYLETYSSKEDVFEDMKRRLDRIEDIVNRSDKE